MSEELINDKLNELNSMTGMKARKPAIPVAVALQEAENLFEWCQKDKAALIAAGLDWKLVEDLQLRAKVLRVCQAKWMSDYKSYRDCQAEWGVAAPETYKLRDELIHYFFHAFYNNQIEYSRVQRIAKGKTHADMIQDLIELADLGSGHTAELQTIGMDLSLLEKARTRSFEIAKLLAKVNGSRMAASPALELRNKANKHLKEAVNEIRRVGRFVFWRNELRRSGYISLHKRRLNQVRKKNKGKPEN